jgi:hypothetical protein
LSGVELVGRGALARPAADADAAACSGRRSRSDAAFHCRLAGSHPDDDKRWLADHLHLPVSYFGKTTEIIRTKAWFLKHYATIISPELKANVLKQDPEAYFKNYQGVMVGDGGRNIWLEDFGDEVAGIPARFEIITINNSD